MTEDVSIPFHGLTFLNTRDAGSAPLLTQMLEERGGSVVECPTIEITPPRSWDAFDKRLQTVTQDDWIVFTSANAVRACLDRLWTLNRPPGVITQARIAAIGLGTGNALREAKIKVDLIPSVSQQEVLLRAILRQMKRGDRVWIPRAQEARDVLVKGLQGAGYEVVVTPVYRTITPKAGLQPALETLRGGQIDWMLFTSTSTVDNFFDLLDEESRRTFEHRWPNVACIGAVTAETARKHGLHVQVVPARQDLMGMVNAIESHLSGGGGA